ncbi:uncharacterized protein LOC122508131 [Leptopilina heterotoma]|uniref:uncharacterized protein LOC122508131 n=1 Tax=Leptopilina heterotoma TaxID=63436 RepID=UPI001CA7F872|nr:uncharacterized protein LOC122508131 [Leptopilina heterotoma]
MLNVCTGTDYKSAMGNGNSAKLHSTDLHVNQYSESSSFLVDDADPNTKCVAMFLFHFTASSPSPSLFSFFPSWKNSPFNLCKFYIPSQFFDLLRRDFQDIQNNFQSSIHIRREEFIWIFLDVHDFMIKQGSSRRVTNGISTSHFVLIFHCIGYFSSNAKKCLSKL